MQYNAIYIPRNLFLIRLKGITIKAGIPQDINIAGVHGRDSVVFTEAVTAIGSRSSGTSFYGTTIHGQPTGVHRTSMLFVALSFDSDKHGAMGAIHVLETSWSLFVPWLPQALTKLRLHGHIISHDSLLFL